MRGALAVIGIMAAVGPARADHDVQRALFVQARLSASSAFASTDPSVSFAADQAVLEAGAWCEGNPKTALGEAFTVVFARPIAITQLAIDTSIDPSMAIGIPYGEIARVLAVSISTDDGRSFAAAATARGAFYVDIGGPPVRTLTVAITQVNRAGVACVRQLVLSHGSGVIYRVYPGDVAALDRVVDDVAALAEALARCDAVGLAKRVTFPIEHLVPSHGPGPDRREAIANVGALVRLCRVQHYSLGDTTDAALADLTFSSATSGSIGLHDLVYADGRWTLRALVDR